MTAVFARRTFAATLVAAMATAAAPTLAGAFADDPAPAFAPDFTKSVFVTADDNVDFPTVLNRPFHEVGLPKTIGIEFPTAVSTSWTDYSLDPGSAAGQPVSALDTTTTVAAPYLVGADGTKHLGTAAVDGSDANMLDVTPPTGLADGAYTLHVTAFDKSGCPDITFPADPTATHSCTTYDGDVSAAGSDEPFSFHIDTTGPVVTIDPASVVPVTAQNIKAITLSGTTDPDTQSLGLTITSSDPNSAPRFVPANVTEAITGGKSTWSATANLSSLGDGTLSIAAVGTDFAGNKSKPAAKATTTMAAHPSAPRNLKAVATDAGAALTWLAPTTNGGDKITGYSVTATDVTDDSAAPKTTSFPCSATACPTAGKVQGLTNGDHYLLDLSAVTAAGKGAVAQAAVFPRAATTLTSSLSSRTVTAGKVVTIAGRLTQTKGAHGIKSATITITPKFDNGKLGKAFTATTDVFGVWTTHFTAAHDAVYVVRYAGDGKDLPAVVRNHSLVRAAIRFSHNVSGGKAVLSGHVAPNKAGKAVRIYRHTATGNRLLGMVRLSKTSSFTFTFALPVGTTTVFAAIGKTAGNLGNKTGNVKLTR